jgi:hypothetical protein
MRKFPWSVAVGSLLFANIAHSQNVEVTLRRTDHADGGPALFHLAIPRPYFETIWGGNREALKGGPVRTITLRALYPSFAPEPGATHGEPRSDSVRIIIEAIEKRHGGRGDAGGFRLELDSRGVNRLTPIGESLGQGQFQRYLSVDRKTEAYSFKDTDGNTIYARCLLSGAVCRAWRTWKAEFRLDYLFSISLKEDFVAVDAGVVKLVSTFIGPQKRKVQNLPSNHAFESNPSPGSLARALHRER